MFKFPSKKKDENAESNRLSSPMPSDTHRFVLCDIEELEDNSYAWVIGYIPKGSPVSVNAPFKHGGCFWRVDIGKLSNGWQNIHSGGLRRWGVSTTCYGRCNATGCFADVTHQPFRISIVDESSQEEIWSSTETVALKENEGFDQGTVVSRFLPAEVVLLLRNSSGEFTLKMTIISDGIRQTGQEGSNTIIHSSPLTEQDQLEGENTAGLVESDTHFISCKKLQDHYEELTEFSENIKALLLDADDFDVTLDVSGRSFKAHRVILKARSPVFNKMFQHGMAEQESGVVEITDCDSSAFGVFLGYIYSGLFDGIDSNNVSELYYIANKYGAETLSQKCFNFMKMNLTVEKFCEFVSAIVLACEESSFIEDAINFFANNLEQIGTSAAWKDFFKDNPLQANELILKAHLKFASKYKCKAAE